MTQDTKRDNLPLSLSVLINGVSAEHDVSDFPDKLTFCARIPENGENGILRIFRDDDGAVLCLPMEKTENGFSLTVVGKDLCADTGGALLYYRIEYDTDTGHVWFSKEENGLLPLLRYADENIHAFQWTIRAENADTTVPAWLYGGILYHIFVDRFCKGEETMRAQGADYRVRPDAVYNPDWENGVPQHAKYPGGRVANNEFFGGTLWGVAEKLPYLVSLGVSALYLSPVFSAYSNHKYDTGDYETIDEMFGGDRAFAFLLSEAKKYGIAVLCDGVFNHTGDDSRYFNRYGKYASLGAYQSKDSPYYPWYRFRRFPDDYESWWGVDVLPAVYSGNPAYRAYICGENGILHRWMAMGVAGWRLDVADELSDAFLYDLHDRVKAEKKDAMLYGEVWEDASYKIAYGHRRRYFRGRQLDSVMNYPFREGVIAFIRDGNAGMLAATMETLWRHYPAGAVHTLMNSLGTHDTERILTVLAGDACGERDNDMLAAVRMTGEQRARGIRLLRLAALLQFTLPGIPCIYYGDEAGMEGYRDPFNRRPYPWGNADTALLAWYGKLGAVRRSVPALADGDFSVVTRENGVFAFLRTKGEKTYYICVNRGDAPHPVSTGVWKNLLTGEAITNNASVMPDDGVFLEKTE